MISSDGPVFPDAVNESFVIGEQQSRLATNFFRYKIVETTYIGVYISHGNKV
jgi:hypothetical protein